MNTTPNTPKEMSAEEIATEIFYSPATNGMAKSSIQNGVRLIKEYAAQQAAKPKTINPNEPRYFQVKSIEVIEKPTIENLEEAVSFLKRSIKAARPDEDIVVGDHYRQIRNIENIISQIPAQYTLSDMEDLRQRCADNAELTHKYLNYQSIPEEYEVDKQSILSTEIPKKGSGALTPMDYGECIKCIEYAAKQPANPSIENLEEAATAADADDAADKFCRENELSNAQRVRERYAFKAGWKANPNQYALSDMREAFDEGRQWRDDDSGFDDWIATF